MLARKAGSVRKGEALAGWLHGVAYHTALHARRAAARRRRHERRAPVRPEASEPDVGWREVQAVLDEEVARLSPPCRAAFVLCCLEGHSHSEAARRLGIQEGTVSSRLAAARKRLRAALARRGIALSAVLAALAVSGGATAAVPKALAELATRAAAQAAAGGVATGLPAKVLSLAEGAIPTMFTVKWKLATVFVFALGTLGAGAALLSLPDAAGAGGAPPAAPAGAAAPDAAKDAPAPVLLAGRVLGPDGKPVPGAEVALWSAGKAGPRAKAGADGAFRLEVPPEQVKAGARLVARAKGFGPDWVNLGAEKGRADITLRLPADDLPVAGRVLDLEGKPVAGATVEVLSLRKPAEGDLVPWLDSVRRGYYPDLPRLGAEALGGPTTLTTDKEGRFRRSGFGRERAVGLRVKGPGLQQTEFSVITRPERPEGMPGGSYGVYAATFDLLVGPGRSIVGTVRDKKTGEPIEGVTISSATGGWVFATSDARGRYRIDGVGKHDTYYVSAGGKMPYFNCSKLDVPGRPGLEPIPVDFELERGVLVRGRLTDASTGKPVGGSVSYRSFSDNPNLADFSDINQPQIFAKAPGGVRPDGSFEVLAIPGRGALCVSASPRNRYPQRIPEGIHSGKLGGLIPEQYHAIIPIDVDPDDPKSLTRDVALEPGRTLPGSVAGPDGKPLAGAYVVGLSPVARKTIEGPEPLAKAEFRVGGMDERPRKLLFVHPGKKLAKLLTVTAGAPEPLAVRLEPLGSLTGRVTTGGKAPQPGVKVTAVPTREIGRYGKEAPPLDLFLNYDEFWGKRLRAEATTDEGGRFRLDGLVPGLRYRVEWGEGEKLSSPRAAAVAVESGKVTDLGDLTAAKGGENP